MGLRADAGTIPSPRRMPWARSVGSDRKGAQAIRPMGFSTVLGPDAVWGAPNPVVEQAGGNPAGSRISESHAAKRARPSLKVQGTRSVASPVSIGMPIVN